MINRLILYLKLGMQPAYQQPAIVLIIILSSILSLIYKMSENSERDQKRYI